MVEAKYYIDSPMLIVVENDQFAVELQADHTTPTKRNTKAVKRPKTKGCCPPFIFVLANGAPELILNVDRADQLASFAVVWAFVQDFRVFVKDFLVVLGSATHLSGIRRRNANNDEIFLA